MHHSGIVTVALGPVGDEKRKNSSRKQYQSYLFNVP